MDKARSSVGRVVSSGREQQKYHLLKVTSWRTMQKGKEAESKAEPRSGQQKSLQEHTA